MRPNRIAVSKEDQTLSVSWPDGRETAFPLDAMRNACPCASCMGGHDNMGRLPDPDSFRVPSLMSWDNVRVAAVGTYGIRITWDDGHDAGIWTWQRLRDISELLQ